MNDQIEQKEVVVNYLTANELKGFDFHVDEDELERKIRDTLNRYQDKTIGDLLSTIKDNVRVKNLEGHFWTKEKVELKYIGGYPRIGDLPREWSQCSVVDIAKLIQENEYDFDTLKSIKRIRLIQPHINTISKYLHPILLAGGEIRKTGVFLSLPYDSDDGNHRLIAMALSGKTSTLAYVGIP